MGGISYLYDKDDSGKIMKTRLPQTQWNRHSASPCHSYREAQKHLKELKTLAKQDHAENISYCIEKKTQVIYWAKMWWKK